MYLLILLLAIVLAILFIYYTRHSDRRQTVIDNDRPPALGREDISGKEPIILGFGTFIAGVDIPPGRYLATATNEVDFGSFVVYELGTSYPEISEVLGYFADSAYVPSIALTLVQDQVIEIKKLIEVTFTPLSTEFKTELTTGIWEVGLDIKPGTYTISSKDGRSGELTLYEENLPVARALLGKEGLKFQESETITIKAGQIIRISHLPAILFEE